MSSPVSVGQQVARTHHNHSMCDTMIARKHSALLAEHAQSLWLARHEDYQTGRETTEVPISNSRNPTKQETVGAIIQGISEAQKHYKIAYQSHIFNSEYCPEYLMTVYIFRSLLELKDSKCGCPYGLSLEQRVRTIMSHLPRKRGRYPNKLRAGGKIDLVLWDIEDWQDEKPLAAIEVKENGQNYDKDLRRLAALVERNLEFSILASCQVKEVRGSRKVAEDELVRTISSMSKAIKRYLMTLNGDLHLESRWGAIEDLQLEGDEQIFVWCPVCFLICRRERA
jgi:hypothetical protein